MVSRSNAGSEDRHVKSHPLSGLVTLSGADVGWFSDRLARTRIAIFGLEGHGADLAALLVRSGIGSLTLADPFPCLEQNLALASLYQRTDIGQPRQEAAARRIKSAHAGARINDVGRQEITAALVDTIAPNVDLIVSCFDRGFRSVDYWINRAALRHGPAALFSELSSVTAIAGPLVIPGTSACYMCYRMRELACSSDLSLALAREELLDSQRCPQLHERRVLPSLSQSIASTLCLEIVKHLLCLPGRSLAGAVLSINPIDVQNVLHPVLQQPQCPDCIARCDRIASSVEPKPQGEVERLRNILERADQLVSRRVGIVTELSLIEKDYHDPETPFVAQALLAHTSLDEEGGARTATSGKGTTAAEAYAGALGEAIESYCGDAWIGESIVRAPRGELSGVALDPRDLVLFQDDQYDALPYPRYNDGMTLSWIRAQSLLTGEPIHVPAMSMLPVIRFGVEELLFRPSSSGTGAGVSRAEAVLRAVLELIEHDAFMIAWLNRLPGSRIDPMTHPDPGVRGYCAALARRKGAVCLIALPTDSPAHVFLAIALSQERSVPAAATGLGAGLSAATAARSAIWEAEQVRVILKRQLRDERQQQRLALINDEPKNVKTPDEHSLLYCHPDQAARLKFILDSPFEEFQWDAGLDRQPPPHCAEDSLGTLLDDFRERWLDVLHLDITTPDVATLGLHAARVIIPGYQPIHFGSEARLGGQRLYDLPVRLGLRKEPIGVEELNLYPHPLG